MTVSIGIRHVILISQDHSKPSSVSNRFIIYYYSSRNGSCSCQEGNGLLFMYCPACYEYGARKKVYYLKSPRRVELITPVVNDLWVLYRCVKLMSFFLFGFLATFSLYLSTRQCMSRLVTSFVGQKLIGKKLRTWETLAYLGFGCFSNAQPKEENKSPTMSRIIIVPYFFLTFLQLFFYSDVRERTLCHQNHTAFLPLINTVLWY